MDRSPREAIEAAVQELVQTGTQLNPEGLLYEEKPGGFQCATCRFALRSEEDGKGTCVLHTGAIDLNQGCCSAWTADTRQLQGVYA